MPYIILRGLWFHIIVLNVYAPTEDKTDDVMDNFCEELELIFDKFRKYPMTILLRHFIAKVGKGDMFIATIGNASFHKMTNDN
jgi:hypothetical protein